MENDFNQIIEKKGAKTTLYGLIVILFVIFLISMAFYLIRIENDSLAYYIWENIVM